MTVNGSILGRETVALISRGNQWGVENPVAKGLFLLEDGISYSQEMLPWQENGSVWQMDRDPGTITTGLDFRQYLRFDDLRGIAYTLGGSAYQTPVEINAGKGDYRHIIDPSADNYSDFASIAFKKGTMIQSFPSVKFAGFTVTGQVNPGRMEIKYHTFANNLITNSTSFTTLTFDSPDYPVGNGGILFFRNLKIWIKDRDGTAFDLSDLLSNSLTNFEFSFQRQLAGDYTNTSGMEIEEPVEDGIAESDINLSFRNLDSDIQNFFDTWKSNGRYKMRIEITGAAASEATGDVSPATIKIDLPNVSVERAEPGVYSGPGRIAASASFKALALPQEITVAEMPFNQPFRLEAVNNQAVKAIL